MYFDLKKNLHNAKHISYTVPTSYLRQIRPIHLDKHDFILFTEGPTYVDSSIDTLSLQPDNVTSATKDCH